MKWKICCIKEVKTIWKTHGGSMNIVRYEGTCPVCKHYIGLTRTSKKESIKILKEYNLYGKI